jgi:hypothetical protein
LKVELTDKRAAKTLNKADIKVCKVFRNQGDARDALIVRIVRIVRIV